MKMVTWTSGYSALFFALLFLSFGVETFAKRGCSAFGHSCFGGHGKRSDSNVLEDILPENSGTDHESQDFDVSRLDDKIMLTDSNRKFQDQQLASHRRDLDSEMGINGK